jgi:hypothetical protein
MVVGVEIVQPTTPVSIGVMSQRAPDHQTLKRRGVVWVVKVVGVKFRR